MDIEPRRLKIKLEQTKARPCPPREGTKVFLTQKAGNPRISCFKILPYKTSAYQPLKFLLPTFLFKEKYGSKKSMVIS